MTLVGVLGCVYLGLFYADPGSGMLIWQLTTAAALGLLFYARTIVQKIRELMRTDEQNEKKTSATKQ